MRPFNLIAIASGLILSAVSLSAVETNTSPAPPLKLCIATFNLRYASSNTPNSWAERRPVMRDCLRQLAPDLIGTQEGVHQQLKDIAADLPDHDWIGTGRDGGNKGEFMAIFYRRDRFEPLTTNHFWLSDTPEIVASSTWGNTCKRMVTWVRFRERRTGREFYFWNTHLDHEVEAARQKGAALVRERVAALKTDLPIVLTGDFNCAGGRSHAYDTLVKEGGFTDTWTIAKSRVNEALNSFNGFQTPKTNSVRIDWVLVRGAATVDKTEVVNFSQAGQYPSDHFPVAAWLMFK